MAQATEGLRSQRRGGAHKELAWRLLGHLGTVRQWVGPPGGRHSLGAATDLAWRGNGQITWAREDSFEGDPQEAWSG